MKPFSDACERNKAPILIVLGQEFASVENVLEVGSGTGQHAVYFGEHLTHLTWHTSDLEENHDGIMQWLDEHKLDNVHSPVTLDVSNSEWPGDQFDAVFSANTAHIMSWPEVELMFDGIGHMLRPQGVFCLYGPFNEGGEFTSESNRSFDELLKARDVAMGLRDINDLVDLGHRADLTLARKHPMPTNNQILVFEKAS